MSAVDIAEALISAAADVRAVVIVVADGQIVLRSSGMPQDDLVRTLYLCADSAADDLEPPSEARH